MRFTPLKRTRQPQGTATIDRANSYNNNVRFGFSAGTPATKVNTGTKVATPGGVAVFSATDNAVQFSRDPTFQNSSTTTVQVLMWVPINPSARAKIFGTRGTTAGDGNRRGWEVSLDGGSLIEAELQVIDSAGSRSSDIVALGYSGTDVAGQLVWATIQVVRVPATSTTLTMWLKTRGLTETTGAVTIPTAFGDDTTGLNCPEICGLTAGGGSGGVDYQILGFIARTGTISSTQRQQFYSNPWQSFQGQPRRLFAEDGGAASVTGTFTSTLDNATLAAAGAVTDVGSFATTMGDATLAASGTVGNAPSGTFSATLDGFTMAATGTVNDTGAFATTMDGMTLTASGIVAQHATGTFTTTLGDMTLSAAGFVGTPPVNAFFKRRPKTSRNFPLQ